MGPKLHTLCKEGHQKLGGTSSNNDTCTKFEFNPSTSWGSYARHRHNLLHGARSTTDIKPWHKHTTGELKTRQLQKKETKMDEYMALPTFSIRG